MRTFEATVHGDTTSNRSVKLSGRGRDRLSTVPDGQHANVGIATGKLQDVQARNYKQISVTYSGKADDESSEVMLNVERFHHTSMDLFDSSSTIAWDISVVSKGVESG